MDGFFPWLPLNPLHPLADGDAMAAGFKKQFLISDSLGTRTILKWLTRRVFAKCSRPKERCGPMSLQNAWKRPRVKPSRHA
jgi:hypothetical protein